MRCIFCSEEKPPSLEHVFPLSIGGTITTDRVCADCNSTLGTRVDAALVDFLPVRTRRAQLGLAGNAGAAPPMHEIFLGVANLVGEPGARVKTTFNKATGQLETRQLYQASDVVMPDGKKTRQITLDARDKDQIPTIIQRERARHGLPPLTEEQLAAAANNYTTTVVDKPLLQVSLSVSFAYLRHAMMKIAYELAFLWLGESYLDDPVAAELRAAILAPDIASTDGLQGYVGEAKDCTAFQFWTPHGAHHLAFAAVVGGNVLLSARVLDIYACAVVVSREATRYIRDRADYRKLRFLAIDSASGKMVNTSYQEEESRLASAMAANRRPPPFPDPL
jgi:hypothetical protein